MCLTDTFVPWDNIEWVCEFYSNCELQELTNVYVLGMIYI